MIQSDEKKIINSLVKPNSFSVLEKKNKKLLITLLYGFVTLITYPGQSCTTLFGSILYSLLVLITTPLFCSFHPSPGIIETVN